ncbi:MAG: DUF2726 domain-containing protein [Fibrobacter sp.]|nr:DUF2726 domain-containing protein [Fibrobacter sp.]
MTYLIILAIAVGAIYQYSKINSKNSRNDASSSVNSQRYPIGEFNSQKFALTKTEMRFFSQLDFIKPENRHILMKVRLCDVVKPAAKGKQGYADWGRIKSKHLDFVIIDPTTSKIISCIELDDYSHNSKAAKKRDKTKDIALKSAQVKLYRFQVRNQYDPEQLKEVWGEEETGTIKEGSQ